jgi:D-lactate dehydrogenase
MDLNALNRGYFDAARLRTFRRGAVFVNISRGELSPTTALVESLRTGHLGGVGLDVYDHEPALAVAQRAGVAADDPEVRAALELVKMENVICTPHNAFNSVEAVHRKSEHSIRQIVAFFKTGQFEWPVPSCRETPRNQADLGLAERPHFTAQ